MRSECVFPAVNPSLANACIRFGESAQYSRWRGFKNIWSSWKKKHENHNEIQICILNLIYIYKYRYITKRQKYEFYSKIYGLFSVRRWTNPPTAVWTVTAVIVISHSAKLCMDYNRSSNLYIIIYEYLWL